MPRSELDLNPVQHITSDARENVNVAVVTTDGDARRIVACVNACAELDTEELEREPTSIKKALENSAIWHQQRDELLAALKLCRFDSLNMTIADMQFISAAIAKAEAA